ncbi:MAG TPA: archaeosortase/exosortase family protein [Candidatus Saccharimonadia bacterium]|nr:archaeosortase/exosortase family protein [Candidatus Saccharimonadia bacterium]
MLFIVVSGVVGPRVISGGILFRDGFAVYGGIGKALIFGLIAFVLLARHHRLNVGLRPWRPALLGWLVAALAALGLAWVGLGQLLAGEQTPLNLGLAHGGLLLGLALAAIGCIGPHNLRAIGRQYRRELAGSVALAAGFYAFLLAVYALWQPLAATVLVGVTGLLSLSGLHATIIPPNILMFDKFGISIAEYCSGIESIALFTGLYVVVGVLDWRRLRKGRYATIFPLALLVLFLLNIVRVYGLIMAGYYINPQLAFSLFHTYAGMVFFIGYSAIFWAVAYDHLVRPSWDVV